MTTLAIDLKNVSLSADGVQILNNISWQIKPGERWAVMGPNGSGKTSLLKIISAQMHPSKGQVKIFDQILGSTHINILRKSIGFTSHSVLDQIRGDIKVSDAVVTAKNAALEPWWHSYDDTDYAVAEKLLTSVGLKNFSRRKLKSLSAGERQRVLIARALFNKPSLLILDEPYSGLDLPGREELISVIDKLAEQEPSLSIIMVSHFTEEIPSSFNHIFLLKAGSKHSSGRLDEVLTSNSLSECLGTSLKIHKTNERWICVSS